MIAIIVQALWNLSRTALKSKFLVVIGVLAVVLNGFGVSPLIVLAIAGIASGAAAWFKRRGDVSSAAIPTFGKLGLLLGTATAAVPVSLITPQLAAVGDLFRRSGNASRLMYSNGGANESSFCRNLLSESE